MRLVSSSWSLLLAGICVVLFVRLAPAAVYRIEPDDFAENTVLNDISALVDLRIFDGIIYTSFPNDFGIQPDPTIIPVTANENPDIFGGYFTSTGTKTFGHAGIEFFPESRQLGMRFLTTTSQVTIDFIGTNALAEEIGVLQVYTRAGVLLETYTAPPVLAHQVATLSITRPLGDIGYARAFSSSAGDPFGTLDNLRFVTALTGDYNMNSVVDAGDYVVWRKGLSATFMQNHYTQWRQMFGTTSGAGTGWGTPNAIPEPATAALLLVSMIVATIASVRPTRQDRTAWRSG